MFASMLMKKIIKKAAEEHPVIISGNCINNIQNHFSCSVCGDSCKEGVFVAKEPRFDKCTNCNLCSVACPAQTILPSALITRKIVGNIEAKKEKYMFIAIKGTGLMI